MTCERVHRSGPHADARLGRRPASDGPFSMVNDTSPFSARSFRKRVRLLPGLRLRSWKTSVPLPGRTHFRAQRPSPANGAPPGAGRGRLRARGAWGRTGGAWGRTGRRAAPGRGAAFLEPLERPPNQPACPHSSGQSASQARGPGRVTGRNTKEVVLTPTVPIPAIDRLGAPRRGRAPRAAKAARRDGDGDGAASAFRTRRPTFAEREPPSGRARRAGCAGAISSDRPLWQPGGQGTLNCGARLLAGRPPRPAGSQHGNETVSMEMSL